MPDATTSLEQLLDRRMLHVPDYQRAYAWETPQLTEFWEDLELIEDARTHYTGTLVLKERGERVHDEDRQMPLTQHDVVDGQQRLTTCMMLLDRLLDHRERLSDASAPVVRSQLLTASIAGTVRPKLKLSADTDGYWCDVIIDGIPALEGQPLAAHRRLSAAAAFFEEKIESQRRTLERNHFLSWLKKMTGRVSGSLEFTVYEVRDDAEVGVIFETLNQRGKPLSEMEKTKNYLLFLASRLPKGLRKTVADKVNSHFATIFKNLGHESLSPSSEDQLLRAHWIATVDPDTRRWTGANSIKSKMNRRRYLESPDLAPKEILAYTDSLARASWAYREIVLHLDDSFTAFKGDATDARAAAARLRNSGNSALFIPLLIATRLALPDASKAFISLLDMCERYSVRVFMIGERRSNAGSSQLYSLAHDVHQAEESSMPPKERRAVVEGARLKIASMVHYYAPDDACLTALLDTQKNWYAKPRHKYFLYQYELDLLGKKAPALTYEAFTGSNRDQTTEHILPQNLDAPGWKSFPTAARTHLTHCLGNLVLTTDNSAYRDFSFKRKRDGDPKHPSSPCYRTSLLLQEQEIAQVEAWNPESIEARQLRLAQWAMTRWAVTVDAEAPSETAARAADIALAEATEAVDLELDVDL